MSNAEQHGLSGRLTIVLHDANGHIKQTYCVNNLITTAGKNLVAEMFTGAVQEKPDLVIAVGSGVSAANVSDTKLQDQRDEVEANATGPKTVAQEDVEKVVATVTATLPELAEGEEQKLTEAGIIFKFLGADPVLYNHVTFSPVTRSANLQMTLSWEVTF